MDATGKAGLLLEGLSVLVAEDNFLIAMSLANDLQDLGCAVVGPFARVDMCLAAAETAQIDGAILDVNLVGGEVYPVAEALRSREIPFIFCTGLVETALPASFRDRPYLTKPFERGALADLMVNSFTSGK